MSVLVAVAVAVAALLSAIAVSAQSPQHPPCFTPDELVAYQLPPAPNRFNARVLTVERDGWQGHFLTTTIANLLLTEVMGYRTVVTDFGSGDLTRLASGLADMNLEYWPGSHSPDVFQRVVIVEDTVTDAGTLGVIGLSGWYIPTYAIASHPASYLDFWRSYQQSNEILSLFPRAGSTPDGMLVGRGRAFVPPWCALATNPPGCRVDDSDRYAARQCNVTVWNPNCIELMAIEDNYDTGIMPQQIRNLRLNITVLYFGEGLFYDAVEARLRNNELFLAYYWSPSTFIVQHAFTRISFPSPTDLCYSNNTQSYAGFGSINCDFPSQDLIKVYNSKLAHDSAYSDALQLIRRFTLRGIDQTRMLASMPFEAALWDASAFNLSCVWLHANVNRWSEWITNTPLPDNVLLGTWYAIGVAGIIVTAFGAAVAIVVLLFRSTLNPIAFYFPPLLMIASVVGVLLALQTSIVSIIEPRHYPAELFYWVYALSLPVTHACTLATCLRYYLLSSFRDKRSVLLRKEQVQFDLALLFGSERKYHSPEYTVLNAGLMFLPALLSAIIVRFVVSSTESFDPADAGAVVDARHRIVSLVSGCLYVPVIFAASWSIRRKRESFNYRQRLFVYSIGLSVFTLIRLIIMWTFRHEPMTGNQSLFANIWLQCLCSLLYIYIFVVLPGLSTCDCWTGIGGDKTTSVQLMDPTAAHIAGASPPHGHGAGSAPNSARGAGHRHSFSQAGTSGGGGASLVHPMTVGAGSGTSPLHAHDSSPRVASTVVQVETEIDLLDILNNRLGFRYFYYHSILEYSDENVLCWKAIQDYKEKTSVAAMIQLYKTFLSPTAPLQVNIPYTVLTTFNQQYIPFTIPNVQPAPTMEEVQSIFNPIQHELLQLMKRDTLGRFINSTLFDRFLSHIPLPDHELYGEARPSLSLLPGQTLAELVRNRPQSPHGNALGGTGSIHFPSPDRRRPSNAHAVHAAAAQSGAVAATTVGVGITLSGGVTSTKGRSGSGVGVGPAAGGSAGDLFAPSVMSSAGGNSGSSLSRRVQHITKPASASSSGVGAGASSVSLSASTPGVAMGSTDIVPIGLGAIKEIPSPVPSTAVSSAGNNSARDTFSGNGAVSAPAPGTVITVQPTDTLPGSVVTPPGGRAREFSASNPPPGDTNLNSSIPLTAASTSTAAAASGTSTLPLPIIRRSPQQSAASTAASATISPLAASSLAPILTGHMSPPLPSGAMKGASHVPSLPLSTLPAYTGSNTALQQYTAGYNPLGATDDRDRAQFSPSVSTTSIASHSMAVQRPIPSANGAGAAGEERSILQRRPAPGSGPQIVTLNSSGGYNYNIPTTPSNNGATAAAAAAAPANASAPSHVSGGTAAML